MITSKFRFTLPSLLCGFGKRVAQRLRLRPDILLFMLWVAVILYFVFMSIILDGACK